MPLKSIRKLDFHLAVVLFFLATTCFMHIHQGELSLDALRYAHISHLILKTGSWFPLYDEYRETLYANKPPVLFWLTAVSQHLLGFSTFSTRLPSVIFAFIAMLYFHINNRRHFGDYAALWMLALFVSNSMFFKGVVDAGFEGLLLCGGVFIFFATLDAIQHGELSRRTCLYLGLGCACFFVSKPPALVLAVLPSSICCFRWRVKLGTDALSKGLCFVLPVALSSSWLLLVGANYVVRAVDNQIAEPLLLAHGWSENIILWLSKIGIYYAPLSEFLLIFFVYSLFTRSRAKEFAPISVKQARTLCLYWGACIIPVVWFFDARARYLLLPMMALSVYLGTYTAKLWPTIGGRLLCLLLLCSALVLNVCWGVLDLQVHRPNDFVHLLKTEAVRSELSRIAVCVDGKRKQHSWPQLRRTRIAFALYLSSDVPVVSSKQLLKDELYPEHKILCERYCCSRLLEAGFQELENHSRVRILERTRKGMQDLKKNPIAR